MRLKITLNDACNIARTRNGLCLSDTYINISTPLRWKCSKDHEWDAPLDRIKYRNTWCPVCAGRHSFHLEIARKIAIDRGGLCLSIQCTATKELLQWRCSKGHECHEWNASLESVKNKNTWCPHCVGALLWRCSKGYEWNATFNSIKNANSWCPHCSGRYACDIDQAKQIAFSRNEAKPHCSAIKMVEWTDTQIRILIDEQHNTSFNVKKIPAFSVNDLEARYIQLAGNRRARRSRMDAQYFDEFRTHFWKRPEDEFDKIRNINSSNRRQRRIWGNNTPAPSTGEVEHELGQTLPDNRRSRRTSVDSRRSRRRSASPSPPRDAINTNTNNPGVENPEQNIGHSGSIESSSLQPPPYEAIDEAQNNSSEMNQSHVVSNREVAVSGNIPLSQNDSDVSMHDVDPSGHYSAIGDSQTFSNMYSINEEVG
ncbi:355_t:CDS:2 [Entrophospora sp. SA101]|nr:355_t:CDS:2 [Entrophospora sp. SA101]